MGTFTPNVYKNYDLGLTLPNKVVVYWASEGKPTPNYQRKATAVNTKKIVIDVTDTEYEALRHLSLIRYSSVESIAKKQLLKAMRDGIEQHALDIHAIKNAEETMRAAVDVLQRSSINTTDDFPDLPEKERNPIIQAWWDEVQRTLEAHNITNVYPVNFWQKELKVNTGVRNLTIQYDLLNRQYI